ncbi:MAG: aspartate aminotransferase family protein, partial [Bacteroidales bacterium]
MNPLNQTIRDNFYRFLFSPTRTPIGIEITKAEGIFLYDTNNRKIIDLVSGVCVSNIGHGNRAVVEAIKKQLDSHLHLMVYGEIIQSVQVQLAEKLASLLGENLSSIYFVNSGSEANELALKLAKRVTGRTKMVSFKNGYYGSTHGALSVMGSEEYKSSFRPLLPAVEHLDFNSFEQLEKIDEQTACVIGEVVMAEGGVISPVEGYLQALRDRCEEVGALLIFDEIQSGFGRCGELFAFQKYGVEPHILTMAKALGGGMPIGAVATSRVLFSKLHTSPPLGHITTFGGHPLSCAASLASIEFILKERLCEKVYTKSAIFVEALKGHPLVKEVRAEGLLIAVELKSESALEQALKLMLEEGVMSDLFLFSPRSFRIAPPLTITQEEIDVAIAAI